MPNLETKREGKVLERGTLEVLFSGNAVAKILDFLVTFQEWDYSESDLAKYSGVSIKTVQREIHKLEKSGVVRMTRTVGKAKMYRLNKESKAGNLLEKFALTLALDRVEKAAKAEPSRPLVQ